MRPENWVDIIEARVERAKAAGWEAWQASDGVWWIMNDPAGQYSGMGESEWQAFNDVLADAELWDEITAKLGGES